MHIEHIVFCDLFSTRGSTGVFFTSITLSSQTAAGGFFFVRSFSCPGNMAYQKTSGCDHVRCGKCAHDFTYNSRDTQQQGERQVQAQEKEVQSVASEFSLQSLSTRASIGSVSSPFAFSWKRIMKHLSN